MHQLKIGGLRNEASEGVSDCLLKLTENITDIAKISITPLLLSSVFRGFCKVFFKNGCPIRIPCFQLSCAGHM